MKKSRSLALIAMGGMLLGLAGIGQTALADDEVECSADVENGSENETGETSLLGLINLGGIGLLGDGLPLLSNLLCGADLANGLTAGILGAAESEHDDDGDREVECSADMDNDSANDQGETEMFGLLNIGGIGLLGSGIGLLNNTLCGSSILNDATLGILGAAERS